MVNEECRSLLREDQAAMKVLIVELFLDKQPHANMCIKCANLHFSQSHYSWNTLNI